MFDDVNSLEFLASLQKRSPGTFDQLVNRLLSPLYRFLAFGWNIPEADAEEIASDVLLTVHEKVGSFRHGRGAKLTTWIFEIAKNRAIDYHRASRPEYVELADKAATVSFTSDEVSSRTREGVCWLARELEGFSEEDQSLLKWRAISFPYSDIAAWLGITEVAARVRHKRAMEKLLKRAAAAPTTKGAVQS